MSRDDLAAALADDRFELWFQPILALDTLEIVSFEGLARLRVDSDNVIGPDRFIATIESDVALYRDFTDRMIEQAVVFADRCLARGQSPQVSVNLAQASLDDDTLVERVEQLLQRWTVPARQLVFEITEREFIDPASAPSNVLRGLFELGVGLAIDDFGTGWSSLDMLRWLPLGQLKIDRSFLADLDRDAAGRIIVEKVVELAHSLHLVVVAEGIERPDQLAALRAMGCERGQGFLFSRPVPACEAMVLASSAIAPPAPAIGPFRAASSSSADTTFRCDTDADCLGEVIDDVEAFGTLALRALEVMPVAVFVKALDGRIIWSNESHWRRLGVAGPQGVLGQRDLDLHRPDEALHYRYDDLIVLTTGVAVIDREEYQTRPDGVRMSLRTSKFPVRNRFGSVIGLVGFYTEVDAPSV